MGPVRARRHWSRRDPFEPSGIRRCARFQLFYCQAWISWTPHESFSSRPGPRSGFGLPAACTEPRPSTRRRTGAAVPVKRKTLEGADMSLIRNTLLGSTAAISAIAGAQAADLPVAKAAPVEYVRVCTAYGA